MFEDVYKDWKPTAENVNALPEPLRHYIMELETNADPAGIVRENVLTRDLIRETGVVLQRYRTALEQIRDDSPKHDEKDERGWDTGGELESDDPFCFCVRCIAVRALELE